MATEEIKSISDLTRASSINNTDVMLIEDSTTTKSVTAEKLADYVKSKHVITFDDIAGGSVLSIDKGGTGNSNGYIRTGITSGSTAGNYSTIEGHDNKGSGYASHSEGYKTTASDSSSHAEGSNTVASGESSHAEGGLTTASDSYTHAEGYGTLASNICSHAEGHSSKSTSGPSHAEGETTHAAGEASHAEGNKTKAMGTAGHSEGNNTYSKGTGAHSEGHAIATYDPDSDDLSQDEGSWIIASANGAHAEGVAGRSRNEPYSILATGLGSHAEGFGTQAKEQGAHSEGMLTLASAKGSHAEGYKTTASGVYSHAEGQNCVASGQSCHAGGMGSTSSSFSSFSHGTHANAIDSDSVAFNSYTTAEGRSSFAAGSSTKTEASYSAAFGDDTYAYGTNQFCIGMCNTKNGQGKNHAYFSGYKLFQIGNGTSAVYNGDELITPEARSNVFSVSDTAVYGTGTYNTSGADYAEMFEWEDGNPNNEDRAGKFVTLNGSKLVLATSSDNYVLGVVSGKPSVCGDVADDQWNKMYMTDVYGRFLYEDIDYPEEKDEDGNVIREAQTATRLKLNPDYDSTKSYIPRSQRPEWSPVGLLGKLVCLDDGTAQVNGYVEVNDDSIATTASGMTKYRVMERLDDNHIRIMIL